MTLLPRPIRLALWFISIAAFTTFANAANAEISLDTTRIVLSSGHRAAELILFNSGRRDYVAHLRWTHMRQGNDGILYPTGEYVEPADYAAISAWPGRVVIPANGTTKIRLLLPAGPIPDGESRQHLRLDLDPHKGDGPHYAFILPVLERGMVLSPQVSILATQIQFGRSLAVRMVNAKGASPHGQLQVINAQGQVIASMRNVNLYTPGQAVDYRIDLPDYHGEALALVYRGEAEYAGTVFASARIKASPVPRPEPYLDGAVYR